MKFTHLMRLRHSLLCILANYAIKTTKCTVIFSKLMVYNGGSKYIQRATHNNHNPESNKISPAPKLFLTPISQFSYKWKTVCAKKENTVIRLSSSILLISKRTLKENLSQNLIEVNAGATINMQKLVICMMQDLLNRKISKLISL